MGKIVGKNSISSPEKYQDLEIYVKTLGGITSTYISQGEFACFYMLAYDKIILTHFYRIIKKNYKHFRLNFLSQTNFRLDLDVLSNQHPRLEAEKTMQELSSLAQNTAVSKL